MRWWKISFDILIKLLASGGSQVESEVRKGTDAAKDLDKTLDKVGANKGLDATAASADNVANSFEKIRNASAGLAVAGAAGLVLANNLSDAYVEADRLSGQLNALMASRGLSGSVADVKKLAGEIAGLKGLDDDAVAASIGQAIATGRTRGLVEYGIVIDKVGQDAIKAAAKISSQAQAQEVLNQVLRASGGAIETLRANTSAATQAIGEMGVRFGNLEEGFGSGAANVKAALYAGILSPIYDILEASPELQTTVGGVLTIGSAALTTGGSIASVVYQVGLMTTGMNAMGITSVASFGKAAAAAWPLLLRVLAIGAAVLATVAAVYLLSGAWKANNEAAAGQSQLDEAAKEQYDRQQKRLSQGKSSDARAGETFEQYQQRKGFTKDSEVGGQGDPVNQIADIRKTFESLKNGGGELQMPAIVPTATMPLASGAGGESDGVAGAHKKLAAATHAGDKGAAKAAGLALRNAKASARAQVKADKHSDRLLDYQDQTELARIDEEFNTRIAQLQAGQNSSNKAAIDAQIENMKADKEMREADIKAEAAKDPEQANSILDIARIRAQGIRSRIGLSNGGNGSSSSGNGDFSLAQTLSALRGGASLNDLAGGRGGGTLSTQGGGNREVSVPLQTTQERTPTGQLLIRVFGSVTVQDSFAGAMEGF